MIDSQVLIGKSLLCVDGECEELMVRLPCVNDSVPMFKNLNEF